MYGLNDYDLNKIQIKHDLQREYLKSSTFTTQNGEIKNLLDVSFSANHSTRYYSEITNKINTINTIIFTQDVEYSNIFLTITLDGCFRDFLKGDFTRYKPDLHKDLIPNNEVYG